MGKLISKLHTVKEAASTLSMSEKSIRRMLKSGRLRAHYIGKSVRVDLGSIAMPQPKASAEPSEEHQLSDFQKEQVQLGPTLKYSGEFTGEVAGMFVPLGTKDATQARATLVSANGCWATEKASPEDLGVKVVMQRGCARFIKFKGEPTGTWQTKRIPAEHARLLTDEAQATAYALRWAISVGLKTRRTQNLDTNAETLTLDAIAFAWFDGSLAARFSTHVRVKKSVEDDKFRYDKYIRPIVGKRVVASLTGRLAAECADQIVAFMASESPDLSTASQRHVLQIYNRLLNLAVFPLRILPRNDLPVGYLPKVQQRRATAYLYPDEEAKLMGCRDVPVHFRLFFGMQAREGARASEMLALTWKDVDLERGILKLDDNKTGRPRAWKMSDGTLEALRRWKTRLSAKASAKGFVLVDPETGKRVPSGKGARQLRAAMKAANLDRAELFEGSKTRLAMRAHDLRATFVTIALANGRSEAWVTDRTGHTRSAMLYRYKRASRTHEEAQLGDLEPLHEVIPELAELGSRPNGE